ncbi:P-loop ATPase, Sll1717 family [Solimonas terrae]|uniref:ATP-binding protein n=1 Tax=Solimonas terrae TaxID=1396819 RepID=A0A6M2BQ84_9GAMM|nr:hypothetical protein [Solimonas terrae]NGY04249.1 hypothetical protein [Solimonas terrae]
MISAALHEEPRQKTSQALVMHTCEAKFSISGATMSQKLEVLKKLEIGERVAEDEADHLENYFVETDQWQQMYAGEIDVVYGPKGSGKSALYTLLTRKETALFDEGVLIAPAENVMGATVFRAIVIDPPPTELSFIYLWKLYCLALAGRTLREYGIAKEESRALVDALERAGLLPAKGSLSTFFRAVSNYLRNWINRDVASVEYGLSVDPNTGIPALTRKTEFNKETEAQNLGDIPVDELFEIANRALELSGLRLWILFDRLDIAFAGSPDLERNALRALFRAYNDMKGLRNLSLKIFVRNDIWSRITEGGFTEASHIVKAIDIAWSPEGLLNLLVLRLLNSPALVDYLGIDPDEVRSSYEKQRELFYMLLPDKVDTGKNPDTFDWIVSRTTDANGQPVPREIIHLLESAKNIQIKKLERGGDEPDGTQLVDRASLKEALPVVSKVRYEQTLLAEYHDVKDYLQALQGGKCEHTITTLSQIWREDEATTVEVAKRLVEIGFFERRVSGESQTFWVPFLYRGALDLVQGRADA